MVRKEGYFSITDACIKHCRANFLIMRPPQKRPLECFCARWGGEEQCGEHGGMEENAPVLLPHVLVGDNSDKGHFLLEQGAFPRAVGCWCQGWLQQELAQPRCQAGGTKPPQAQLWQGVLFNKHTWAFLIIPTIKNDLFTQIYAALINMPWKLLK